MMPFDAEGARRKQEERVKELAECTNNAEKIALKQVWAIQDMPAPVTNVNNNSSGGGFGLFGLLGLFD